MTEKEREILSTIEKAWPALDAFQRARLLGFGEGLAFTALALTKPAATDDVEPAPRTA